MPVTPEQLKRFSTLFTGYTKLYGTYDVRTTQDNGKRVGKALTIPGPISDAVWRDHLEGTGLGIGIIMLREDDTCRFGVIDVDDYHVDHGRLCKSIQRAELPLVVCRSKSGGAHLYVFTSEDVPAVTMRERLTEWTAVLGLSDKTEQFPKQVSRATGAEIGNWINIPYFDAERGVRFALKDGRSLMLYEFLEYAEASAVPLRYMTLPTNKTLGEGDLFFQAPPCLELIHIQGGFSEGSRNDGMLNIGIYLKKRYPDDWLKRMDEYNREMANLPAAEIVTVNKSLARKEYHYTCKRDPIKAVCQRRLCLSREYGVGQAGTASITVEILALTRYDYPAPDPPMWAFEINGKRVMVDNDTFYSKDLLNRAVMGQANCVPIHMAAPKWLEHLNTLIQGADIIPMPEDAGPSGQLWERIKIFLGQGVDAIAKEEVLTGKVYREDGITYFRSMDLFQYLEARRIRYGSEQRVWQLLREKGAKRVQWQWQKGSHQTANVWSLKFEKAQDTSEFNQLPETVEEF